MRHPKRRWLFAVAVLAVVAGACGGDDGEVDTADLPLAPDEVSDDVVTEPACAPGEPDCDDTAVVPDEGQDLPSDDEATGATGGGDVSSGMTVDGGLTVSEALATDATGVLAVRGHGFFDDDGERLCESLAPGGERYECGGASVMVENLDLDATGAVVVHHDGLSYTDGEITVFGELVDGVLTVNAQVAG